MSLNFFVGEVDAQTVSIQRYCQELIRGMEDLQKEVATFIIMSTE